MPASFCFGTHRRMCAILVSSLPLGSFPPAGSGGVGFGGESGRSLSRFLGSCGDGDWGFFVVNEQGLNSFVLAFCSLFEGGKEWTLPPI